MVRLRQIIFYAFAAIYVIACPLVLSSAFGVVWAPGTDRGLERTGLLSIASLPSDATVFVDHRRYKDRTPMLLRGLQPGTYPVQVTLKGYRAWARPLVIGAGQATVLERLLLLPQRGGFQTRLTAPYEALLPVLGHDVLLLVPAAARLRDVLVYAARREQARRLVDPAGPWAAAVLRRCLTMPEGRDLFCLVATPEGQRYLWLSPERAEEPVEDLTRLVLAAPDAVQWAPRQAETLWVLHGGVLDRIDRRQKAVSPAIAEAVRGLGVRGNAVYLVRDAPRLERLSDDGELLAPLPEKHQPNPRWLAPARQVELTALPEELWLLRDERGQVSLNRPDADVLATGIQGIAAHPTEPYAAVWNAQQVGVVDATAWLGPAAAGPVGPPVRWVFTRHRQVERVFWSPEGDYLLIQEGGALFLAQLWRTPYVTVDRLLEVKAGTQAAWPPGTGSLYYLDPGSGHLWSLELIPERYFSLLRFPRQGSR